MGGETSDGSLECWEILFELRKLGLFVDRDESTLKTPQVKPLVPIDESQLPINKHSVDDAADPRNAIPRHIRTIDKTNIDLVRNMLSGNVSEAVRCTERSVNSLKRIGNCLQSILSRHELSLRVDPLANSLKDEFGWLRDLVLLRGRLDDDDVFSKIRKGLSDTPVKRRGSAAVSRQVSARGHVRSATATPRKALPKPSAVDKKRRVSTSSEADTEPDSVGGIIGFVSGDKESVVSETEGRRRRRSSLLAVIKETDKEETHPEPTSSESTARANTKKPSHPLHVPVISTEPQHNNQTSVSPLPAVVTPTDRQAALVNGVVRGLNPQARMPPVAVAENVEYENREMKRLRQQLDAQTMKYEEAMKMLDCKMRELAKAEFGVRAGDDKECELRGLLSDAKKEQRHLLEDQRELEKDLAHKERIIRHLLDMIIPEHQVEAQRISSMPRDPIQEPKKRLIQRKLPSNVAMPKAGDLLEEIEKMSSVLNVKERKLRGLESTLEKVQSEKQHLRATFDRVHQQMELLLTKNGKLETTVLASKRRIKEDGKQIASLKEELASIREEITEQNSRAAELEAEISALNSKLRSKDAALADSKKKIDHLKEDREIYQSMVKKQASQIDELVSQVESVQAKLKAKHQECERMIMRARSVNHSFD
eukprot:Rmarinus@m.2117